MATPDQILAALRKQPSLLYRVAVHLLTEDVASPWIHRPHEAYRYRQTPAGKKVCRVQRHRTRRLHPWEAMVTNPHGDKHRENFQQESDALQWCDGLLTEQGYLLAEAG